MRYAAPARRTARNSGAEAARITASPALVAGRMALALAPGLAARAQPACDLVERALMSIGQAEPELDHPSLARLEGTQHVVDLVLEVGHERGRRGGFCGGVLDQVTEL